MTRVQAEKLFKEAFIEVKGPPPSTVDIKDTVPLTALDVDSLDLIEMMMVVSDLAHWAIPDTAVASVETVGDVIEALASLDAAL